MLRKYRNDIILIVTIVGLCVVFLIIYLVFLNDSGEAKRALVYRQGELILEVSLSDDGVYEIQGEISVMHIEVKDKQVRVLDSGCSNQICVNDGFKGHVDEIITCLPNYVTVKLVGGE